MTDETKPLSEAEREFLGKTVHVVGDAREVLQGGSPEHVLDRVAHAAFRAGLGFDRRSKAEDRYDRCPNCGEDAWTTGVDSIHVFPVVMCSGCDVTYRRLKNTPEPEGGEKTDPFLDTREGLIRQIFSLTAAIVTRDSIIEGHQEQIKGLRAEVERLRGERDAPVNLGTLTTDDLSSIEIIVIGDDGDEIDQTVRASAVMRVFDRFRAKLKQSEEYVSRLKRDDENWAQDVTELRSKLKETEAGRNSARASRDSLKHHVNSGAKERRRFRQEAAENRKQSSMAITSAGLSEKRAERAEQSLADTIRESAEIHERLTGERDLAKRTIDEIEELDSHGIGIDQVIRNVEQECGRLREALEEAATWIGYLAQDGSDSKNLSIRLRKIASTKPGEKRKPKAVDTASGPEPVDFTAEDKS